MPRPGYRSTPAAVAWTTRVADSPDAHEPPGAPPCPNQRRPRPRRAREDQTVSARAPRPGSCSASTPEVIAARVGGACATSRTSCADGDEVEPVAIDSADGRDILRHSTAHVMAQAVQELFPDARLGIGPPIENGFYYDFDVETPFVPEDLEKIETRMRKIVKENQRFQRRAGLRRRRPGRAGGGALQARADRAQGLGPPTPPRAPAPRSGAGELTIYDNLEPQGRGGLEGPLPRSAPAHDQADPGLQADALRRGVLARRREEQAAAAHLRHRLGDQGGARGAPPPHRGGRAARPPQARPRPRPVQLPRRDRLRACPSSTPRAA